VAVSRPGARSAGAQTAPRRDTADAAAADYAALREHVRRSREEPFTAVRRAVLSHELVLFGDVHPAAEPKTLLLRLLEDPGVSDRLDAVALEIPASAQRWIERYLQSSPEDPGLLFRDRGTLRAVWGGSEQWLAIFHRLWELQRTRERPLAVIAMDLPGWPSAARSARAAASLYADRDSAMASALVEAIAACYGCDRRGGPRVLAFLGGYHVLRGLEADLSVGPNTARVIWLATRLERRGVHPYTILTDGLPRRVPIGRETSYGATRLFDVLAREGWPAPPYAIPSDPALDLVRHAVREPDDPADISFALRPASYELSAAVDLFVFWGRTTPLGERHMPRPLGRE
jgi:hypothetical protein